MSLRIHQVAQFQLTLTPALRMSLDVLQMSTFELETYLTQQLEENPVLEVQEPLDGAAAPDHQNGKNGKETEQNGPPELDDGFRDLWRTSGGSLADGPDDDQPQRESAARPASLYESLILQLHCLQPDPVDQRIAEAIIGWLDPDGYLRTPLEEIAGVEGIQVADVERVLPLLHRLEPAGVGARDLQECLLIQLAHLKQDQSLAARIVRDAFDLFTKRKIKQLTSRLGVTFEEVRRACQLLARLDPKPARNFSNDTDPGYLQNPDLIVRAANGELQVELNDDQMPALHLSARYRSMLRDPGADPQTKAFLRQKLRNAIWLLKAISQRQDTLLSIGRCLADLERDYFLYGVSHLKALRQETVAQAIGCHASTVSRAIAGKTLQTPYGIVPLSAFFGGGVKRPERSDGAHVSPKTIQAEIGQMITAEDPAKPLSDQAIAEMLQQRGLPVARRTVAKYRAALKLLPAHLRKRSF